ncbi:MAG: hypothetical protein AUJ49_11895, partial [Desulfovibrionaceae bacterium CG1_02_65_16]
MSAAAEKNARAIILANLRQGLAESPFAVAEPPARPEPDSHDASAQGWPGMWARLGEVLEPLSVRLRLAGNPAEAASHAADIARERGAKSYTRWDAALDGLGLETALAALERVDAAPCRELGGVDLGLALAHGVLVESGTMVLAAGPGRHRAASLLPPASVIFAPRSALLADVGLLPELLHRLEAGGRPPACVNLISGPSSTADIELVLVRGVHGPANLD